MQGENLTVTEALERGKVSCKNIGWCFDFCHDHQLDINKVLQGVDHDLTDLRNPANFIHWQSLATFCDNFFEYMDETEIRRAGQNSWQSKNLNVYRLVGRNLYSVSEQYRRAFAPKGVVEQLYPCKLSLVELEPGHIKLSLRMNTGLNASRSFQTVLAGQMVGLPEALGYKRARVLVSHHINGADYDIVFEPNSGILAPLRRLVTRPFMMRESALELESAYQALQTKYFELEQETQKLKQTEQVASINLARYKLLAENTTDVIWTATLAGELDYISPSVTSLLAYTATEIKQLSFHQLLPQSALSTLLNYLENIKTAKASALNVKQFEVMLHQKTGRAIWVEGNAQIVLDKSGQAKSIVGAISDITERKKVELALSRSEENYRVITDTARDAIFTFDELGKITFANPSTLEVFNYPAKDIIGQPVKLIIPAAYRNTPKELQQVGRGNLILDGRTSDKRKITLELSFVCYKRQGTSVYISIARDVSQRIEDEQERERLQAQLLSIQKLESIGQLTGGIAHDFNNLLVAINGYAELGMGRGVDKNLIHSYFSEIHLAGNRAADMTQKLLAFSRRQIIEPSVMDICQLVANLKGLFDRLLPTNINLIFSYEKYCINVRADSSQMEQMLINLAVNARDAMSGGGVLKIHCSEQVISADYHAQHNYAEPGVYACIEVSDDGCGISEEVQKRIFEPFYTTKPEGEGTGLGMAVAFGIIKQHEGFIDLESKLDAGATFKVFLPLCNDEPSEHQPVISHTEPKGNETILLSEDNMQVRNLSTLVLEKAGFKVIATKDGEAALSVYEQQAEEIDILVLDVVMPRMGGYEVFEKIKANNPDVKVIFTSGYSEQGIHTDFILEQGLAFLQKPYQTRALCEKVRHMLDETES